MPNFIAIPVLTGYLTYLRFYYETYLHDYVIDHFEIHNPECLSPHQVASSADFYLKVVANEEKELSTQSLPVTVENISSVMDGLCLQIQRIEAAIYPLKKILILESLLETQVHIEDAALIDELTVFLKRRLLERKLYFL